MSKTSIYRNKYINKQISSFGLFSIMIVLFGNKLYFLKSELCKALEKMLKFLYWKNTNYIIFIWLLTCICLWFSTFYHLTVFFIDFNYFLYISDVELDPNRVWCPSAGCETICTFQPASNPDIGVSVLCLKVRKYFII